MSPPAKVPQPEIWIIDSNGQKWQVENYYTIEADDIEAILKPDYEMSPALKYLSGLASGTLQLTMEDE